MKNLLNSASLPLVPGLVFVLVSAITVAIMLHVRGLERSKDVNQFEHAAVDRVSAVQRQYELSIAAVDLVGTLFDTDEEVTELEFETFVDPILSRHPAISALSYAPVISLEQRSAFEAQARLRHPDYQITERVSQGEMKPASARTEFVPVRYIAPLKENEVALGFDLASDPARNAALKLAAEQNLVAATSPLILVQETNASYSFLLFRPIYRKTAALDSALARQRAVIGYVSTVIRSDNLISSALAQLQPAGVDFTIADTTSRGQPMVLGSHYSRTRISPDDAMSDSNPKSLLSAQSFSMSGRQYSVELFPAPGFFEDKMSPASWTLLVAGLSFGLALAAFLWLMQDSDRKLRDSADSLRHLSERLIRVQENERGKLSRDLHDEVGQAVTALQLNLHALAGSNSLDETGNLLSDSNQIVERIIQQVRDITLDLRPPMLDDLGLDAALHWYLKRQTTRAGLGLNYSFDPAIRRFPEAVETAAYRLVQESITNVIRHAQATAVTVDVQLDKHALEIIMTDNGIGISAMHLASTDSVGLSGLRQRAQLAGGTVFALAAPDGGTMIKARFSKTGHLPGFDLNA